jgi:RNase P subunit RPR2
VSFASSDDGYVQVFIHCSACGNSELVNVDTGASAAMRIRVMTTQLAELREDLRRSTCNVCRGPMVVDVDAD